MVQFNFRIRILGARGGSVDEGSLGGLGVAMGVNEWSDRSRDRDGDRGGAHVAGNFLDLGLLSYEERHHGRARGSLSANLKLPTSAVTNSTWRGSSSSIIAKWKRKRSGFNLNRDIGPGHNSKSNNISPRTVVGRGSTSFFKRLHLGNGYGRNESGTFPLDGISVSVTTQTHKDPSFDGGLEFSGDGLRDESSGSVSSFFCFFLVMIY